MTDYGIRSMLNGLYCGNFIKTLSFYETIEPTGNAEVISDFLIDLNWFKMHCINKVLTFVIAKQNAMCHRGFSESKVTDYDLVKKISPLQVF